MPFIPISTYYPHPNPDYAGNPLIEVIPPLDTDTISSLLTVLPPFSIEERSHPDSRRLEYLQRLSRYYVPLDRQVEAVRGIWSGVLEGLRIRDPRKTTTRESFLDLCDQIVSGNVFIDCGSLHTSTLFFAMIGIAGIGKTVTARRLFDRLPRTGFHHHRHGRLFQVLAVWVNCPDTEGYNGLLKEIVAKLSELCDEEGLIYPRLRKSGATRADLEAQVVLLARLLNLGILIIDEIQHAATGKNQLDQKVMQFMTGFVNRLQIPVLAIGTWKALQIIAPELRMIRRSIGIGSGLCWRLKEDDEWEAFLTGLFEYQWIRKPVELTPELTKRFYYHCQGIIDFAVKLMQLAQLTAIQIGGETIDVALLDYVAESHFLLVSPVIKQLREGRFESDPIFEDFEDIDPVDLEEYLTSMITRTHLSLANTRGNARKGIESYTAQIKEARIATGLMAAGIDREKDANALAKDLVAAEPTTPPGQIIAKAIRDAQPKGPRLTKSAKRNAELDEEFSKLDDSDLRKQAYFAAKDKIALSEILFANGLVVDCSSEMAI